MLTLSPFSITLKFVHSNQQCPSPISQIADLAKIATTGFLTTTQLAELHDISITEQLHSKILASLPKQWHNLVQTEDPSPHINPPLYYFKYHPDNRTTTQCDIKNSNTKAFYNSITKPHWQKAYQHHTSNRPFYRTHWERFFNGFIDWKTIFLMIHNFDLDRSTSDILFRFIHHGITSKDFLHKATLADSPICSRCKVEIETQQHLFFSCIFSEHLFANIHPIFQEQMHNIPSFLFSVSNSVTTQMFKFAFIKAIWYERNMATFEGITTYTFKVFQSFVQQYAQTYISQHGTDTLPPCVHKTFKFRKTGILKPQLRLLSS